MDYSQDIPTDVPCGQIDDDCPCAHCGYNLRGLHREAKCPECFTPVGQSVHGNLLRYADPKWLDRIRFGVVLKLWNIVVGLVIGVGAFVVTVLGLPLAFIVVLGLAGGLFGLWASFAITTQEPRISLQEDPVTWRKAIRTSAVVGFLGALPQQIGQITQLPLLALHLGGLMQLASPITVFGELLYFSRFALRVPDHKLARSTRIVMWALASVTALGVVAGVVIASVVPLAGGAAFGGGGTVAASATTQVPASTSVTDGGGGTTPAGSTQVTPALPPTPATGGSPSPGLFVFAGLGCVLGVAGLVFFLWYIRLLTNYKGIFTEAARQARAMAAGAESSDAEAASEP